MFISIDSGVSPDVKPEVTVSISNPRTSQYGCYQTVIFFMRKDISFIGQCVVPENIHTPQGGQRKFRGEGGPKVGNFRGGKGWPLESFFGGLRARVFFQFPSKSRGVVYILSIKAYSHKT